MLRWMSSYVELRSTCSRLAVSWDVFRRPMGRHAAHNPAAAAARCEGRSPPHRPALDLQWGTHGRAPIRRPPEVVPLGAGRHGREIAAGRRESARTMGP